MSEIAYNVPGSFGHNAVEFYKGQWVYVCGQPEYPCVSTNPQAMEAVRMWQRINQAKFESLKA